MEFQAPRDADRSVMRGFVAAGGQSTRMGRDKARLAWGTGSLLEHAARRVLGACGNVEILCGPERRYEDLGFPVRVDVVRDAGPLGGLLTALETGDDVLLLGVDLPAVPEALLGRLVELRAEADIIAPVLPSGPEPLCAVYAGGCRAAVAQAVERADLRMRGFWKGLRVRELREPELSAFGDPRALFRNVNTPEDYAGASTKER